VGVRALSLSLMLAVPAALAGSQSWKNTTPESFTANAQVLSRAGGAASVVAIQIQRYTADTEHGEIVNALKGGDHAAFLEVLHRAPVVGSVTIGQRSTPIRWARERREGDGRRIGVVTESPLFFAGAGAADAKPTAGFDIGVLEFTVDSVGLGRGSMAGAARVKAGGPTGIEIEDYSGKKITLVSVTRKIPDKPNVRD
jgi:hypothetical protein